MAVVEQVRFSIFSQQEIKELQNDVMDLEELAERKNIAEQKIRKTSLAKRGGIFGPNELDDALPSAITKKEGNSLISRAAQSKFANSIKSTDRTSAAAFVRSNAFKEIQKDVSLLKEGQDKTQDALSFLTDFKGTAATKLIGAASNFLPIGFVLSIATTVFGLIQAQFGSGGIFDTRKQELNSVKSLIGLERETDIIGGDTLFLGNPTLVQGVARNQTSNTENLRDGQRRFVLRSNGY
jgi:hypothetical protein